LRGVNHKRSDAEAPPAAPAVRVTPLFVAEVRLSTLPFTLASRRSWADKLIVPDKKTVRNRMFFIYLLRSSSSEVSIKGRGRSRFTVFVWNCHPRGRTCKARE